MSLEIYKKIEIEKELQKLINEGKTREEAVSCLINEDDLVSANYIIEAYLMPIDEITSEIEKYDNSKPKLDEIAFIKELCTRYNVDRKAIIERIQNVRKINRQKKFDTPERLEDLKRKRDLLQKEKDKLSNKSMDTEEKSMYYFGLGVVTIVGGIIFYPASPVLVGLLPVAYAATIPAIRLSSIYKKEFHLVNELVDLGKEIEYLDTRFKEEDKVNLDNNYDYVVLSSNNFEHNVDENEIKEEVVSSKTLVKRRKK